MSNFVMTTKKEYKGSTAAPSMTIGTSSMLPVTGGSGVEMSGTQSQQTATVQSVNNHTEVKDSTLPTEWKAYKDAKGSIFYVNSSTMTTTWNHPNEAAATTEGETYGAGW